MRPLARRPLPISIVLGGGWTLGGSYHAGVLLALEDTWGVDPRQVDTIIGTSSGAVTAGYVAAGLGAEDLFNREVGAQVGDDAEALLAPARNGRVAPERALIRIGSGLPAKPTLTLRGAGRRQRIALGTMLAGWLPRGTRSHRPLRRYFDELHRADWPTRPRLRLCAVDLQTGRRVVIDDRSPATPGEAIAASCALPGWHRPVKIGDSELIDGALHSVDNSDAAVNCGTELVIVSSPLSTDKLLLDPMTPLAALRNFAGATSRAEQRFVERNSRMVAIRPSAADVRVMGTDLTVRDRRRRREVARQAYRTAREVFRRERGLLDVG